MTDRIAIVGAGIAGASLAYRLARAGHAPLVIDDGRPGRATGWNPGGINPLHGPGFPGVMEGFYRRAFELHADQHQEVRAASGIEFGWRVIDRLFLAQDDAEGGDLQTLAADYNARDGFSARWMDAAEVARWDSRVARSWAGGLMTRGNVRVDSERYRLALLAAAARAGAEVVTGRVRSVQARGDTVVSIGVGQETIAVAGICAATGSWGGDEIAGWSSGVPVAPLIGDLLLVRSAEAPPLADVGHGLTAIYQHDGEYFWIGGTTRRDGPVGESTAAIERQLLDGAHALMPGWNISAVVGRSSAARPASADGLPVVGQSPSYRNGWIINGLGGKGILLSAWAAESITQMIATGDEPPEFAAVSPRRPID